MKKIEVIIKKARAIEKKFTVVSERIHIMDVPGIEDSAYGQAILKYL